MNHPVVQYHFDEIKQRWEKVDAWMRAHFTADTDPKIREVLYRLIRSPHLREVFGCTEGGIGSDRYWIDPLDHLEFIEWFVGHELLDDGSPIIYWPKVGDDGLPAWDDLPYIRHSTDELPSGAVWIDVDDVLKILDIHEAVLVRRVKEENTRRRTMHNLFGGTLRLQTMPEPNERQKVLIALADEYKELA